MLTWGEVAIVSTALHGKFPKHGWLAECVLSSCLFFVKAVSKLFLPLHVMWQSTQRMFFSPGLIWGLCHSWGKWAPFFLDTPQARSSLFLPWSHHHGVLRVRPWLQVPGQNIFLFLNVCLDAYGFFKHNVPKTQFSYSHFSFSPYLTSQPGISLIFHLFLFFIFYRWIQRNVVISTPTPPPASPLNTPSQPLLLLLLLLRQNLSVEFIWEECIGRAEGRERRETETDREREGGEGSHNFIFYITSSSHIKSRRWGG